MAHIGYNRFPEVAAVTGNGATLWRKARLTWRIARRVLPRAAAELDRWTGLARTIPNEELRRQALASLRYKRFHAEGGSVYAAAARNTDSAAALVGLIVALQTTSDYLDNLTDRSASRDPADFRRLHQAMIDAVTLGGPTADYYALHPNKDDGGYLLSLVQACRESLARLPGYPAAMPHVRYLAGLYSDLQVHKHGPQEERREALVRWFAGHRHAHPGLEWWEFAAATGSTLGMFALFLAATDPALDDAAARRVADAYFPWVCGLHILLDYLIDREEDRLGGDLNLTAPYPDLDHARERLALFQRNARLAVRRLPDTAFHELVVDGLPALYLSDPKTRRQNMGSLARRLLRTAGPASLLLFGYCSLRRAMPRHRSFNGLQPGSP